MTGKNKIERGVRLWWDDANGTARDLSFSLIPGTIAGGGKILDAIDVTGAVQEFKNYLAGTGNAEVSAQFIMDDTAVTGSHTVLSTTLKSHGTLTLQFGSNGDTPSDDPEWEGEYVLVQIPVSQNAGKMIINARWMPYGEQDPDWGISGSYLARLPDDSGYWTFGSGDRIAWRT